MSTTLLTMGITTSEIGMLTAEPMMKPRIHKSQNCTLNPVFTSVIMKVMMKDMTTEVRAANKISRYFLFILNVISYTMKEANR